MLFLWLFSDANNALHCSNCVDVGLGWLLWTSLNLCSLVRFVMKGWGARWSSVRIERPPVDSLLDKSFQLNMSEVLYNGKSLNFVSMRGVFENAMDESEEDIIQCCTRLSCKVWTTKIRQVVHEWFPLVVVEFRFMYNGNILVCWMELSQFVWGLTGISVFCLLS